MGKTKTIQTQNAAELAKVLGLSRSHATEWEIQSTLLLRLIDIVKKSKVTHAEVAKAAKTSRTRITSILNGNIDHVSTDLLIRILGSLGYEVTVSISRTKLVA